MSRRTARLSLPDDEATTRLGQTLAPLLGQGDTVLLEGPIGAGKTHLARAIIQSRLAARGLREDVPSPTYTLVQTYTDGEVEIWHADLYRVGGPDEVSELGIEDAFASAITLIEWPDRLGPLAPEDALWVRLAHDGDARIARFEASDARWDMVLEKVSRHD